MRSSLLSVAALASMAVASPLGKYLNKKAIIWDIVTDLVYVTVTDDGHLPKTTSTTEESTVVVHHTRTHWTQPTESSILSVEIASSTAAPAPPAPTTTAAEVVVPTTTAAEVVVPVTTQAPTPTEAPETTLIPVVVASSSSSSIPSVVNQAVAAPASSAASDASDATPTDLASTGVFYHNKHRANHSAPDVTWDSNLADYAQTLANTCNFHHDQTIGGGGYGQNIDAQGMSGSNTATSVPAWDPSLVLANAITNNWYYAEEPAFPYGIASPIEGATQIFHFSQVVWKETTTVGCAVKYCGQDILPGNYGWYAVCNYGPAGNYLGRFATDVVKPAGAAALKVVTPWA